ncbi:MAG: alpha/beta hydrolase, partial [Clostridia bacterium]|nr:alpha/beta hydrolase [Clostridia bacterium]
MFQLSKLALKILAHLFRSNDRKRDKGLCEPDGLTAHRNLVYQPQNGEAGLLDIYTPQEGTEALPTIISVHGGGFCYGDKERYRFYCMELALQGYTVVNFNYRLLPFRCPAPLCDFNDVMHFIWRHAQEYRINPHRLYAVGDSAGATILHMYTTLLTNPDYAKMYDLTPPDLRFCAIALHSGSFALARKHNFVLREWIKGVKEGQALLRAAEYIGGNYPPT